MKAISQIIATILILLIAVSLVVMLYVWSTGILPKIYSGENSTKEYLRSRACLNIESAGWSDAYAVIKNCGYVPLKDFKVYVNGKNVSAIVPVKLDPQEVGEVQITSPHPLTDSYDILVTADLAESPVVTVVK